MSADLERAAAFFEGHVHAFAMLRGVPCGKVRYDNLRSAVARLLGLSALAPTCC